ncbi:MAG: hypothetical protein H7244_06090 [Herminiimonas sp.]|nr:hypothetical protein [Herminiimonas sp.]
MPTRRLLLTALLTTVAAASLGVSNGALAIERPFPTFAKRGVMKPDQFPAIVIDGKPRILTPGARIWSTDNLTVTPGQLGPASVAVNYTEDESFYIDRVWILTPDEAAQSPRAQNINQPRQ